MTEKLHSKSDLLNDRWKVFVITGVAFPIPSERTFLAHLLDRRHLRLEHRVQRQFHNTSPFLLNFRHDFTEDHKHSPEVSRSGKLMENEPCVN